MKDKGIINYNHEFIQRIMVHKEKEEKSDVDEREKSRHSCSIEIKEVAQNYGKMMNLCREAISQCEEVVFSDNPLEVPSELAL